MQNKPWWVQLILWLLALSWFFGILTFGILTKKFTWHVPVVLIIFLCGVGIYFWQHYIREKK